MLKKLVGYAAVMSGATSLLRILTFGVGMLGIKLKTKNQYGDYATYALIYGIAQGFFIFGANQVIQKFAADSENLRQRFARLAVMLFVALMVLTGVIGVGVGWYFNNWPVALGVFGIPWIVVWWWARYIYRSTLEAKGEAALAIIASLANSLLTLGFLVGTDYGNALIYGDFLALVVGGLFALMMIPRAVDMSMWQLMKVEVPRAWLKEMYEFGKALWVAGQVFAAGNWMQGLVTRGKLGAAAMGAYGVMGQLAQFIHMPMDMIAHASLPSLVAEKEENRPAMYRELVRVCLVAFPFVALAIAAAMPLLLDVLDWVFLLIGHPSEPLRSKYPEVHILLAIMALGTPAAAVEIVAGQYAIAEGHRKAPLQVQIVAVAAILAFLWPMSSAFGLFGILIAGSLGEVAKALAYIWILWKPFKQNMKTSLIYGAISTVSTVLGFGPIFLYQDWKYNYVMCIPAMVLFFTGMVLFRLIHREDFRRVYRAVRGGSLSSSDFDLAPEGFARTIYELEALKIDVPSSTPAPSEDDDTAQS